MKKLCINSLLIFSVIFALGCKKTAKPILSPTLTYRLTDSVNYIINSMTGTTTTLGSSSTNGQIIVNWVLADSTLIVNNSDSFTKYQVNKYNLKGGSFPLVGFIADTISFTTKLGGVGTQSWYVVYGKKM